MNPQLPALPADVVASITPESEFTVTNHMNNTPDEDSGLHPGENTFTFKIGGKQYSATKEQLAEAHERAGRNPETKEFLTENFPDQFGKTKA